ncbi:hypothetical protein [Fervidibacillus halotolerans]|uniref:Endolytic transglycosylase MltG n=1 Tax=Fervidibacillus halotolerans TaxID=2980027 RepID=A0A9E8LZA4_9BACI|nr:hypothetical protein [Fervidibacillus halotolerans]WAA11469.1 hypothetical protein OE105_07430 [Fervidibacillus halotolerans]
MDRKILQAFSLGMLFVSISIFSYFTFFLGDELERAKQTMVEHGYTYIKKDHLNNLEEQIAQLKKENTELQSTLSEKKEKTEEKGESSQLVEIEIEPGMVLDTIAQMLEEKGVINNKREFVKFVEQSDKQTGIRTGVFHLHEKMTYDEIVLIITK